MKNRDYWARGLLSLLPEGGWGATDDTREYEQIIWRDNKPLIPKDVLIAECDVQEEVWLNNAHQRVRIDKYPSVKEQLDMIWHAIDQGALDKTSEFYLAIKKIKDENPKGQ